MRRHHAVAIFLIALALSARAQSPAHQYQLDETPISEGTTALDSAGSLNGTYHGNPTAVAGLYTSGAAHFDGAGDGVQLTNSSTQLIGTASALTMTAFIKVDAGYVGADRFLYDESAQSDTPAFRPSFLWRINSAGNFEFGFKPGGTGGFAFATLTTPALDPATWYLVAATFDTTNGEKVYLFDALTRTLIGSATNANTLPNSGATNNATIGAWTGGGSFAGENNSFLGTIDDFRIYNSALTQAQIAAVPEPSAIALSIFGASAVFVARRIRRRAI